MRFERVEQTVNKAVVRRTLLRWAMFNFLIGSCEGLDPGPWWGLVGVMQYPGIDHELAMARGDAFSLDEVGAFQLADFAQRCAGDRNLLKREAARLAKLVVEQAPAQALAGDYIDNGERTFAVQLRDFVVGQVTRLTRLAGDAAKIEPEFL